MGQVPTAATTSLHAIYAEDALGSLELDRMEGGKPSDFFLRHSPKKTRWWFQIFFIFTPTWGRFPV